MLVKVSLTSKFNYNYFILDEVRFSDFENDSEYTSSMRNQVKGLTS